MSSKSNGLFWIAEPMKERFPYSRRPKGRRAFSLLELLVTLSIVGMVSGLMMPALTSLVGAKEFSRNAYEISDLLKFAQAEARAKQSFVRVGFAPCQVQGSQALKVAAFIAADGSGENLTVANQLPLSRVVLLRNTTLVGWQDLSAQTRNLRPDTTPSSLGKISLPPVSLAAPGVDFQHVITFTPRGEAVLKEAVSPDNGYDPQIDISLRQTRGLATPVGAQEAAILIDGSTGTASVVRL
jgi:prepilin-type N-terminal cleavage/methylation domain-containing protein